MMKEHRDLYQIVTEKILAELEHGTVPWHKPWKGARNLITDREYRGINAMLLGVQPYNSPYWLSMKQCNELGGHVRKGERSSLVVFWHWAEATETEEDTSEETVKKHAMLRYYLVFNVEQCEGVRMPRRPQHQAPNPIEAAQSIVETMPNAPAIHNSSGSAYYDIPSDSVHVPTPEHFESAEEYHSVLFHELVHSTGHSSRCARGIETNGRFGSTSYSKEELVAEMGAAFLCARAGIGTRTIDNSAAYINGWLLALRNDRRLVIMAASAAQRAADYILRAPGPVSVGPSVQLLAPREWAQGVAA